MRCRRRRKLTGRRSGAPRKLTDAQVAEIVASVRLLDRVREECSRAALAKKYGVSRWLIQDIAVHGRWFREESKVKRCRAALSAQA
jgi:hypothetical protein